MLAVAAAGAFAQTEEVLTVKRDGYAISGLATYQTANPQHKLGIALFPGHPGIMKIQGGAAPKFEMKGNFLIRTRQLWADEETLVLSIDAPSDQWSTFYVEFRQTPRYGEDVAALLREAAQKYGVQEWTFIGTSEGSISAFHAARMNPALARRLILTSSLFQSTRNGRGLASSIELERLPAQTLWVHHVDDPCPYTPYRDAQDFAKRSGKPLLTVRGGGGWRGDRCQAFTAHGYAGVERETVAAMREWVKTGTARAEVGGASQ
jgi:pimeloyl-ACP methyl ester carboxylesterase